MKVVLFLLLCLAISSCQKTYPPGLNFMMKNIIFDKIREIVIPDIMEQFKTIKPPDIDHKSGLYEIKIYDMVANIVPLTAGQITIDFLESNNTMTVKVVDFETNFDCKSYGRALFIHAHGSAGIHVKVDEFSFNVQPKLKADGDLNDLDYDFGFIRIDLHSGDIKMTHLSIGILPSWLLTPLANIIIESFTGVYHAFENLIDDLILEVLNKHRASIPDSIVIPGEPLSFSLSFPDLMQLKSDRVEVPFDGTIFVTSSGYHPQSDPAPAMPSYDAANPNNVQVFVNQHMLKTWFQAVKDANMKYEINSDTLKPLNLTQNIMTTEYFDMIFPYMSCPYDDPNSDVTINLTVDKKLNTAITFGEKSVRGEFSPSLEFYVNGKLGIIIAMRAIFEATVDFKMQDKETFMTGNVTALDLADFKFTAGTVKDTDLGDIISNLKPFVIPTVTSAINGIVNKGFTIPVIPLVKDVFEIDLEDIEMVMHENYLEASFTLDIHQRLALIEKLLKKQDE